MQINSKILSLFFLIICTLYSCKNSSPVKNSSKQKQKTKAAQDTEKVNNVQKVYHPSRTLKNDLLHTKLELQLDWQNQYVNGIATLSFKPYFYPQDSLILDAKGFDIDYIKRVKEDNNTALSYENTGRKLKIALDKTYTRDEKYKISIKYTAKPNELKTPDGKAITENKGFYFINPSGKIKDKPRQFWTQGEPEANSCWFPTIDAPNEKTTQEVYLRVDTSLTTLSNGELIYSMTHEDGTKTDYWKQSKPHAPYLVMVAGGNHEIIKDQWKDMPVNYYVEPEYAPHAKAIFGNTPEMISFFSEKFGYTYPWKKYSSIVVRDFVSGAMENTTATVFMEDLHATKRELIDQSWDDIIAHELSHHWFGNIVTCESWANLPLNESFATYSEYLWQEYKNGKDAAAYKRQNQLKEYFIEAQSKKKDLIRYYYESIDGMFDRHSYSKGSCILHMLRKYVGDEAFFTTLKKYLHTHEYQPVEVHDLRLAFEEVTKEDLNWFFNQWFLDKGHPELKVTDHYNNDSLTIDIKQTQDTNTSPVYKLPLKIAYWVNDEKIVKNIIVHNIHETFTFPAEQQPQLAIVDYEQQLAGNIEHNKKLDELVFQYNHARHYDARHEAINMIADSLNQEPAITTMQNALNDQFWYIQTLSLKHLRNHYTDKTLPNTIQDKVTSLARSNSKPDVRSNAINLLSASANGDDFLSLYKDKFKDSSYKVTALALKGYLMHEKDVDRINNIAVDFEKSDNVNIIITLARYYTSNDYKNKYKWFKQKMEDATDRELIAYLDSYSKFIAMLDQEEEQKTGINKLKKLAMNHHMDWIKIVAYKSLGNLKDLNGVKAIRKEIRENEKDKNVKRYYEMLP